MGVPLSPKQTLCNEHICMKGQAYFQEWDYFVEGSLFINTAMYTKYVEQMSKLN